MQGVGSRRRSPSLPSKSYTRATVSWLLPNRRGTTLCRLPTRVDRWHGSICPFVITFETLWLSRRVFSSEATSQRRCFTACASTGCCSFAFCTFGGAMSNRTNSLSLASSCLPRTHRPHALWPCSSGRKGLNGCRRPTMPWSVALYNPILWSSRSRALPKAKLCTVRTCNCTTMDPSCAVRFLAGLVLC
jgi:hypothetical protein